MAGLFRKAISEVEVKLRQILAEGMYQARSLVGVLNAEDETVESSRLFYLFSIMLLISLAFLSPDKIPQVLGSSTTVSGVTEKVEDLAEIVRKLVAI